jgi:hypothetical protein
MNIQLKLNNGDESILNKAKNPQYLIENNNIQFTNLCRDEVIGVIKIIKNKEGLFQLSFERRNDYEENFIDIHDHDKYFKSINKKISAKMVMVLESPHIKEFYTPDLVNFNGEKTNARPANGVNAKTGDTGKNIDNYIQLSDQEIIQKILEIANIDSNIIEDQIPILLSFSLINAIQYQCSLGVATKHYRDEVFTKLWGNKLLRNNFNQRIKNFQPDIIINSCTQGDLKEEEMCELLHYQNSDLNNIQIKGLMNDIVLKTKTKKDSSLQGLLTKALISQEYKVDFTTSHPCSWSRIQNYMFSLKNL